MFSSFLSAGHRRTRPSTKSAPAHKATVPFPLFAIVPQRPPLDNKKFFKSKTFLVFCQDPLPLSLQGAKRRGNPFLPSSVSCQGVPLGEALPTVAALPFADFASSAQAAYPSAYRTRHASLTSLRLLSPTKAQSAFVGDPMRKRRRCHDGSLASSATGGASGPSPCQGRFSFISARRSAQGPCIKRHDRALFLSVCEQKGTERIA